MTWVVVDVLGLAVGGLLHLHHLGPGRGLGGHVNRDKPHRHILRHLHTGERGVLYCTVLYCTELYR